MRFLTDNWFYILIFVGMVYMMFRGGGCCGGDHGIHNNSHNGDEHMAHKSYRENNTKYVENPETINTDIVKDPVCGMNISKTDSISRYINGRTYYFCGDNCVNKFERNPAKSDVL
jgi:YHS domain-containing protein